MDLTDLNQASICFDVYTEYYFEPEPMFTDMLIPRYFEPEPIPYTYNYCSMNFPRKKIIFEKKNSKKKIFISKYFG